MARTFRTEENYQVERTTREMLKSFILECRFSDVHDARKKFGNAESQIIHATDDAGKPIHGLGVMQALAKLHRVLRDKLGQLVMDYDRERIARPND